MKISQREAHRMRRRLAEIEARDERRVNQWSSSYPGGTHMQSLNLEPTSAATLNATNRLGFAMVAKIDGSTLYVYAVKP